jgi:hypothetical protein
VRLGAGRRRSAAFKFRLGATLVYIDAETNHSVGIDLDDDAPQAGCVPEVTADPGLAL